MFSGLLVSIFIVLEPAQSGARGWPAVAAYPMVLSLGVMEWQLQSLRAGARNALVASGSLADFARASRGKLALRAWRTATASTRTVRSWSPWLPGLVIYAAWGVAERVTQPRWALYDARLAFCVAALVSLVAMAGAAVRVVAN